MRGLPSSIARALEVQALLSGAPAPTISGLAVGSPTFVSLVGSTVPIVVEGEHFTGATDVALTDGATDYPCLFTVNDDTHATITRGATAIPRGQYALKLTANGQSGTLADAIRAIPIWAWFDSRYFPVSGTPADLAAVPQIDDVSGNARHGAATSGHQAKYRSLTSLINGLPVIKYDGFSVQHDWHTLPSMAALTSGQFYKLGQNDRTNVGLHIIGTSGVLTNFPYADNVIYDGFGSDTRKTTVNPGSMTAGPYVYSASSAANSWKNYFNDPTTPIFSTNSNNVRFSATPQFGASSSSFGWSGRMQSLIYLSDVATAAENAAIFAYLKALGGVS